MNKDKMTCSNLSPILSCEYLKDVSICTKKEKCVYKMNWYKLNKKVVL